MPSQDWTTSKVAQIAKLTGEKKELESELADLKKVLGELSEEVRLNNMLFNKAEHERIEAVKAKAALVQEVGDLKNSFRDLYQAAQDGVCKKCAQDAQALEEAVSLIRALKRGG